VHAARQQRARGRHQDVHPAAARRRERWQPLRGAHQNAPSPLPYPCGLSKQATGARCQCAQGVGESPNGRPLVTCLTGSHWLNALRWHELVARCLGLVAPGGRVRAERTRRQRSV